MTRGKCDPLGTLKKVKAVISS